MIKPWPTTRIYTICRLPEHLDKFEADASCIQYNTRVPGNIIVMTESFPVDGIGEIVLVAEDENYTYILCLSKIESSRTF